MNKSKEIVLYRTQEGKIPFDEWFRSLSDRMTRARIKNRIDRFYLEDFGDSKLLSGGFFEHRIHLGPGFRVYYGLIGDRLVILLCGGDKRSQRNDIQKAREYWEDYKRTHEHTPFR